MSGPKSYSPPPKFSMQVFDGKLNLVFQLQSRLKILYSEIEGLQVFDSKHNIQFDCKEALSKIRKQVHSVQRLLVFDYKGTFGQDTYNRINGEIDLRISELHELLSVCELLETDFAEKKADYNSFLSYLTFYENSSISFQEFKTQIINYFKTNIESIAPEIFKETEQRISAVEFKMEKVKFSFGFNSKIDTKKQSVIQHVIYNEDSINSIRAEISDRVINKFQATGSKIKLNSTTLIKVSNESTISEKIKSLIRNCDDIAMRRKYKAEFAKLIESESLKDIYFFKELHDSIFETEKTRKAKIEITALLSELSTSSLHSLVQSERQFLVKRCLNLLNNSRIPKNELDDVQNKYGTLKIQSNKYFEEDEIRKKEHLFLKSQLILSLENMGYEVVDDLEVIDFEEEDDLLLKIHNQENYLNLKFKEDGSMRYVFQIAENRDDLNTDQQKMKLHEMKVTCQEFQSVLEDLSKMGLNVDLKSEKPIELNSIVSVRQNVRAKLTTKKIKRQEQKQQFRKKYLN